MIKNMHSAGIRANLIMNFITTEVRGSQNVGFRMRDIKNILSSKRQQELQKGDAATVIEYLEKQQLDNPSFVYSVQFDAEGHMTNFFWNDAR